VTTAVLRRLHRWIGLALAVPLIVQALTGLVLTMEPFVAYVSGVPSANGPLIEAQDLRHVDAAAVLAAARTAVPADQLPRRWRMLPDAVVAVDFAAPGQSAPSSQVGVDVGFMRPIWVRTDPDRLYRWVHSLHETLLSGQTGRAVIGWIGVGLLLLALFGIPLWWPPRRRWTSGFVVSRTATGWRFQRQLHGAAGIWLFGVLALQSVSGIALAFPQTARAIAGLPATGTRTPRPAGDAPIDPVQAIIGGIAYAQAAVPTSVLQDLRLPPVPGRPMMAILQPPGSWAGAPDVVVTLDPVTAHVLSIQDPRSAPAGASLLAWLRSAHEGGAAGPAGRLLTGLFALALPLFPVTGAAMWVLRRRRRRVAREIMAVRQ
jgi:uncharacterized iron-regulated membrane protein